jgi:hypothetical protein
LLGPCCKRVLFGMKSKTQLLGGEQAQVLFWFRIAGGGTARGSSGDLRVSPGFLSFSGSLLQAGGSGMFTNHSKRIAADKLPDR